MYNVYGMYNVIADVVYYLFMQGFLRLKKKSFQYTSMFLQREHRNQKRGKDMNERK